MAHQKNALSYRPNVAAIVIDEIGHILACERSDFANAWQLPQGGIDSGERPIDAFYRELQEEIGTADVELLGQLPQPIRYQWPKELHKRGYCGQEQWYFLARINKTAIIDLNNHDLVEFATYEWVTASNFLSRCKGFKADAYKKAILEFSRQFPDTIKMD